MNSIRLQAFDAIKFFAIYLVLWGHAIQYVMGGDYENNLVFRTIYAFHMPLFMTISGYFATSSLELSLVPFLKRKFMQLLYPAFVFGILVFILLFSTSSFCKINL